ncbi:MAG TPA: DUF4388 domain-containing protein [Anaeromyxobacteraceae bacterium]|nr:DUF4388 domain-containing protein [Anaeromyxobacteraceae bacterium]
MASLLDIDAQGRVLASEEARRALAERAGRFAVLPSAPDLLLLRRTPAAGGRADSPRCVLAGDLAGFPVADLIAFVHHARLGGVLTVSIGGLDRSVSFREGQVRGVRSAVVGERIGEVAVRLGYVTPDQVLEAARAGGLLGKALVDRGALSAGDLWRCLHEQIAGVFHAILLARDGVFHLMNGADGDTPGAAIAVDTQSLLMDAIRRIDELGLFASRIPGPQAFVRRRDPVNPVALQPVEEHVLSLIDGRRRVAEVARAARLSEFDGIKVLFHLAEAGYVEATAEAAPARTPVPLDPATVVEAMNDAYRLVVARMARNGTAGPFLAGLRKFLSDPNSRFAPLWARVAVGEDGSLDEVTLLGNLASLGAPALATIEPSASAGKILSDALQELLFFALFQAGERLPRAEDDALAADVKRRLALLGDLR